MNQDFQHSGNLVKNGRRKIAASAAAQPKVIKNQIVAARSEAARIIEEAEEFAAEIYREAEQQADTLREEAYLQGAENALTELEFNLFEAREIRERVWRESEKDLLRLAVRLAEKIIGRELEKTDETIVDIVSAALQNARQQEKLNVRVNPSDLPVLEKETEKFAGGGRIRFVDFTADPRVSSGGCLIESEVGTIDARLETQLRVLERALISQSEGENAAE